MELPYPARLPYVKSVNIRAPIQFRNPLSWEARRIKNDQKSLLCSINTMSAIKIKRVYEKAAKDEYRILVDRLWPRGLTKEQAAIDLWLKEIAPSPGYVSGLGMIQKDSLNFVPIMLKSLTKSRCLKHKDGTVIIHIGISWSSNH